MPATQVALAVEPLKVEALSREFRFGGRVLPDPGAHLPPDDVRRFYANQPKLRMLTNAAVKGPERIGSKLVWTFEQSVGHKG